MKKIIIAVLAVVAILLTLYFLGSKGSSAIKDVDISVMQSDFGNNIMLVVTLENKSSNNVALKFKTEEFMVVEAYDNNNNKKEIKFTLKDKENNDFVLKLNPGEKKNYGAFIEKITVGNLQSVKIIIKEYNYTKTISLTH